MAYLGRKAIGHITLERISPCCKSVSWDADSEAEMSKQGVREHLGGVSWGSASGEEDRKESKFEQRSSWPW